MEEEDFTTDTEAEKPAPPPASFFERLIFPSRRQVDELNLVMFETLLLRPAYERLLQEMRVREAALNEECNGVNEKVPTSRRGQSL